MLTHTFIHLSGIGRNREQMLWKKGITTWEAYEQHFDRQLSLFDTSKPTFEESRERLRLHDTHYFAERLPSSEYFRITIDYPQDALFLDIETTGSGFRFDQITVVGWSMGNAFGFYIDGDDPAPLLEAIHRCKSVVTFNGTSFDVPIIRKAFPEARFPVCHVDLRFLARRVGLRGGQKKIEKEIGMYRDDDILEMSGMHAPMLWNQYLNGDDEALSTLIRYNYADVYGMKVILDHLVGEILHDYPIPAPGTYRFAKDKGEIPERFKGMEV